MKNKFVQINEFILDVTLSETHKFSSEVTDYPVENGGSFSDNIRPKPMQLTIEGVITNTPLQSNAATQAQIPGGVLSQPAPEAAELVGIIGSFITENVGPIIKHLRSDQAYQYLRNIWLARNGVTVRTSLGVFENMALVDLDIPRTPETGDAIRFTASFQQIEVVNNERLNLPGLSDKDRHGPKTGTPNVGAQILWKRGIQPGGPVIYDTKYVTLEYNKTAKRIEWRYVKQQPISIAAINFQVSRVNGRALNDGPSGFFSMYGPEENRALTEREVFWLNKDLQRDAAARRAKEFAARVSTDETSAVQSEDERTGADRKAASQARSWWDRRGSIDDPEVLRRPIQDPSKLQRSTMKEQGQGTDPFGTASSRRPDKRLRTD